MQLVDAVGWTATALFTASYFFREPSALRRVQMIAALLWIGYGALVGAVPVMVANALVLGAATAATYTTRNAERGTQN